MAIKKTIFPLYCLLIGCIAICCAGRPAYNWDMLPYMGVVLSYSNPDQDAVHRHVYTQARQEVPAVFYSRMTDASNSYRYHAATDAVFFRAQFPLYTVKPLYTILAWVFYKAGVTLTHATVYPSALAYFFTGIIVLCWLGQYWPRGRAAAVSLLLMCSPPLLAAASLSTPDAMSCMFLLAAIALLVEKKSSLLLIVLLALAVGVRIDNILPAGVIIWALGFASQWKTYAGGIQTILAAGVIMVAFLLVSAQASSLGWSVFYYPDFVKQLNTSYAAGSAFSWTAYQALVKSQLMSGLYFSFVCLFLLGAYLVLKDAPWPYTAQFSVAQATVLGFVLIMAMRFLLQPLITDRIYMPYYLATAILVLKKIHSSTKSPVFA
jgi:hypothetical protein